MKQIVPEGQAFKQVQVPYEQIVRELPIAVYATDLNGRLIYYNDSAVAFWGTELQLGTDPWCGPCKIFTSDAGPLPSETSSIRESGQEQTDLYAEEIIIESADGSLRHVDANRRPFYDSSGKMIGSVTTLLDISHRTEKGQTNSNTEKHTGVSIGQARALNVEISHLQRRNEELQLSEERYHKMIEEVEDYAILLLDKDGIIQNWNKGAEKIKGYSQEEILGKHFSTFYLLGDRESGLPQKLLNEAKERGKAVHEGWRMRKDGTQFWGSIVLTALHDESENVIGFSKVTRDLTDKKLAEDRLHEYTAHLNRRTEELRASEERYHKMIEEVEDYAIILLDKDGIVQNWNKGAEKIKGYQQEEIVGKSFSQFYFPKDQEAGLPYMLLAQAKETGKAVHEGWRRRKDGSRFWGSIVLTALHDKLNNIIGFSKVTRDLTERKLTEDQVREYADQLEFQNKELEQFAYAASHDMKEPLRKIHLYNSFVVESSANILDEQSREFLNRSIKAVNRLAGLIEDLLTYSKTTMAFESFEKIDLNEIVEEIKEMHSEEIQQLTLNFEISRLPVIYGVRFQIRQLIFNLVNNAIKYRRPGKTVLIEIQARLVAGSDIGETDADPSRKYQRVSISDNGLGFDPQFADKIFLIFHRLANHSARGSGIGLAICKKIVQNHHGFIKATGQMNEGARFDIYLPETYDSSLQ